MFILRHQIFQEFSLKGLCVTSHKKVLKVHVHVHDVQDTSVSFQTQKVALRELMEELHLYIV